MIFTYSKTGDRHIALNRPSDDALKVFRVKNYSAVILSDGCSSSKFGFEASNRIVNHLSEFLHYPSAYTSWSKSPWEFFKEYMTLGKEEEVAKLIHDEILKETKAMLERYSCERRDLCCTLMLALIEYDPKAKTNNALLMCIGDGIAASYNKKSRCASLITEGDNIHGDPRRTYFCTSVNSAENMRVYRVSCFDSMLISSDGLPHGVNIHTELDKFMKDTESVLAPTDAQFGRSMNLLLASYVLRDKHRDLCDDCTLAYYTTDKKAFKRLVRNNKFHRK